MHGDLDGLAHIALGHTARAHYHDRACGTEAHCVADDVLERTAEQLEVAVHDSGPGVPEKDLGLIFEPFYRVDAARARQGTAGEGLGLAIAARALAAHGGAISARNMPGGGLAVVVTLPLAGSEAERPPAAASAAGAVSASPSA